MQTGAVEMGPPARIQLVTPIRIVSTVGSSPTGQFATLTYTMGVPEPASAALLALGSVVLGAAARRKLRSSPAR